MRFLTDAGTFAVQRSFMKEKGSVMEIETFDAITRRLGSAGSSRRQALRGLGGALLSGAFAGVAARLGLAEETEAKQSPGRKPGAERKPHGGLRSEGTHKGKGKKRRKHRGARGSAGDSGCADGSCVTADQCPPGERKCADGSCLSADRCCPEVVPPSCDACESPVCDQGAWRCRAACQLPDAVCCQGRCVNPCLGDQHVNPQTCQCECPTGEVVLADGATCCPREEACFFNDAGQATICCGEGLMCVGGNLCT